METKTIPSLALTSASLQQVSALSSRPQPQTTARSQPKTERSARTGRSEISETGANMTQRTDMEAMDSVRSTMSTARAHTALAALAAHKSALEARLAVVEAALEAESKRNLLKNLKGNVKLGGAKRSQAK